MTPSPMQMQSDIFGQFILEYPGPVTASAERRFEEALDAGWTPAELVLGARQYRRLTDAQDAEPIPAEQWLASMISEPVPVERVAEAIAFSAAVRALRAVQCMSQADLAARARIGSRTLAQIEAQPAEHQTRHANRLAVADALGWSVEDMVDLGYRVLGS